VSDVDEGVRQAATRNLIAAGCFGAYGLALSVVHAATGFGLACPWRALTGTLCPFCGATRMGSDLLAGDLAGAWSANPFVLTGLAVLGLAVVSWAVTALGGPRLRPPGRLGERRTWFWLTVVVAAVFMVIRNLLPH
jgi:hypothetical protein